MSTSVPVPTTKKITSQDIMLQHPCFSAEAHGRVGRVHLPVAPRCNIQCAFCERRVCAHLSIQHPGWARRTISGDEAVSQVQQLVRDHNGERFVVGVAGPGEPLANRGTFEALRAVHTLYPHLPKCVSTNGLLLEESLPRLLESGVTSLTVTVNASDVGVGQHIYLWAYDGAALHRGREAAELLLGRQLGGIRASLAVGLAVKVNSVLIPGVNGEHMVSLAHLLRDLGVRLMNIMPLIPGGQMADRRAPTCDELRATRDACEAVLPQFRLCEHCRADVVRFPHHASSAV